MAITSKSLTPGLHWYAQKIEIPLFWTRILVSKMPLLVLLVYNTAILLSFRVGWSPAGPASVCSCGVVCWLELCIIHNQLSYIYNVVVTQWIYGNMGSDQLNLDASILAYHYNWMDKETLLFNYLDGLKFCGIFSSESSANFHFHSFTTSDNSHSLT